MSNKEIKKYDNKGNKIYYKDSKGDEYWWEYDKNGNNIHYKGSNNGLEEWSEFDEKNNMIYWKDFDGQEYWYKFDENNEEIDITEQEYKEIEYNRKIKEYDSRTKCSRFEIMDI